MQFAARHAERVAGGYRRRAGDEGQERQGSWRWEAGSRTIELSPALARKAGLGEDHGRRISLLELFRKLDPEGRRAARGRSEEHTSELQSLMRNSYAVFCLKKKKKTKTKL